MSCVYVMGVPGEHLVKVGRSTQPHIRLWHVRSDRKKRGLQLLYQHKTERPIVVELSAHRLLKAHHAPPGKEWFEVGADCAIEAVKRAAHECSPLFAAELTARWAQEDERHRHAAMLAFQNARSSA